MQGKNKNATKKPKRKSRAKKTEGERVAPPDTASREAVRDIFNRLFGNSAEEMVKSLADSNQLTPEEVARMNEIFGKHPKQKRRKG